MAWGGETSMNEPVNTAFAGRKWSRRAVLRTAAVALPGVPLLAPAPAMALASGPRKLSFHHLHTNEKLSVVYFQAGDYVRRGLERLNHFLRDFRSGDVHPIDPGLLDLLYAVQLAADSRGVFKVISGYRSPHTNASLLRQGRGVAKRSLHIQGRAIDVRLTDVRTAGLRDTARRLQRGGVGFYPRNDFVHLDTGRVRSW